MTPRECPFCGSADVELDDCVEDFGNTSMAIFCRNCGASGRLIERPCDDNGGLVEEGSPEYDDVADRLVDLWNTRINSDGLSDRIMELASKLKEELEKNSNVLIPRTSGALMGELLASISDLKRQVQTERMMRSGELSELMSRTSDRRHRLEPAAPTERPDPVPQPERPRPDPLADPSERTAILEDHLASILGRTRPDSQPQPERTAPSIRIVDPAASADGGGCEVGEAAF